MFVRKLNVGIVASDGSVKPALLRWIDNFAMRNFTNDAIFDDTLPLADGVLEAGLRVPLDELEHAMADWFTRKGWMRQGETLSIQSRS